LTTAGQLSGTPQQSGSYTLEMVITNTNGVAFRTTLPLLVAQAGSTTPLLRTATGVPNASVGVPYAFRLDSILRGGGVLSGWTLASGSQLPPGLLLLTGASGAGRYL